MRRFPFAIPAVLLASLVAPVLYAEPVNVNTADADTLAAALRGVGTKTAAAIVAFRESHGRFESVDQLQEVKGIGPVILDRIRDDVLLSDDTDAETSAAE